MQISRSYDSIYTNKGGTLFLHIHVNDGFLIGKSGSEILNFLERLNLRVKLKFKRRPTQHLGYHLDWKSDGSVDLTQKDLILKLLKDNEMKGRRGVKTLCNTKLLKELEAVGEAVMTTYFQRAIETINYIAQNQKADIIFAINSLSRHLTHPNAIHRVALKHLMRYLKGSLDFILCYSKPIRNDSHALLGWADAHYANYRVECKSILGNLSTFCGNCNEKFLMYLIISMSNK
ncbi:hypothetical protein O181_111642 [Austropuccinia psidii MF-1]|uniref:Uncharacterized protein n=1 Tax=Austropuccinia psidii MF-1 TaxID=1389203 RepID=A0A9Q3PTK5_9BASI|nr:hypothetical protein [Austropuccinia psidii MF-1]